MGNRLSSAYLRWLESVDRTGAMTAEHGSTAAWLRAVSRVAPTTASRDGNFIVCLQPGSGMARQLCGADP
jgi:hypothetical protein